jgi:hypothetical protein
LGTGELAPPRMPMQRLGRCSRSALPTIPMFNCFFWGGAFLNIDPDIFEAGNHSKLIAGRVLLQLAVGIPENGCMWIGKHTFPN